MLHDTNLSAVSHCRLNGSVGYGWNNNRGVARVIEEYFRISLRDKVFYSAINLELISDLIYFPWNNGLTVLKLKSETNNYQ